MLSPSPNRINQYKNKGRSGIQTDLRKKCLDRLRESRLTIHNRHRNLDDNIKDVLNEVLASEIGDWSLDDQIAMYELLKKDLLMDEYDQQLADEEERLISMLDVDVFCPSCQRAAMDVDSAQCSCQKCGFKFNFPGTPPSKEALSEILKDAFVKHETSGCLANTLPTLNGTELHFQCEMCPFDLRVF